MQIGDNVIVSNKYGAFQTKVLQISDSSMLCLVDSRIGKIWVMANQLRKV